MRTEENENDLALVCLSTRSASAFPHAAPPEAEPNLTSITFIGIRTNELRNEVGDNVGQEGLITFRCGEDHRTKQIRVSRGTLLELHVSCMVS